MKSIMKKKVSIATLFVAFALTFAFGLCMLATAHKFAYATTTYFDNVSVTLDENIKVNVGINAPDGYTQAKIGFSIGEGQETVTADILNGSAVLSTGLITPQYMNEELVAELTLSGEGMQDITETYSEFSLKGYLTKLLNSTAAELKQTETENALMRSLTVNLLNYGAEAQKYVAAKTETAVGALANADLTSKQQAFATSFETIAPQESDFELESGNENDIVYKSAGLIFDYNVALYVNFTSEDLTDLTVKVTNDGEETTINTFTKAGDLLSFVYDKIAVSQFDNVLSIQAYKGNEKVGGLLRYSVKSFVYAKKDDTSVGELSKATYVYGYSAVAYKNADTTYPAQGEVHADTLYKNSDEYSFMAVDADGNANAEAKKGWYSPSAGSNKGVPTLVESSDAKYLSFNKTAQIELFFNRSGLGKTYHIFDNITNWNNEDAQELFYKEYTYEFEIEADGAFMLGVCDFRSDSGVFLNNSSIYGITFLFDGKTVKMSRYGSGEVEAVATADESVTDGTKKKISFSVVRQDLYNGAIRVFVNEKKVLFEATENYGSGVANGTKGEVKNGTLYIGDAHQYGQRFTVAPQADDNGYSTVKIYGYAKRFVDFEYPEYTVNLVDGLKFSDGTTQRTIKKYTNISSAFNLESYDGVYNVEDGTKFSGVVLNDVTLAGYKKDENDVIPAIQQFSTTPGDGIVGQVKQSDVVIGGKLAKRFVYDKSFTKDYKIRFCNTLADGSKFLPNTTYVSTFKIKNYSAKALVFDLYEITSGHTLTEFTTKVELAAGEVGTYTIEWSFSAENNMLPFIVFNDESDLNGFDFAMALNVVKK